MDNGFAQKGKAKGCLPAVVMIFGLLVLDLTPAVTVLDQEALCGFVYTVGAELFAHYTDKTVQSGVYVQPKTEATVAESIRQLTLASNLSGGTTDAGRASLQLGVIQSRYLDSWQVALESFTKAERLLPHLVEPKYQIARCQIELQQHEAAADKLREALRMGTSLYQELPPGEQSQEQAVHSCLAPYELGKLIFGPANNDRVIESAKRLVQIEEGDNELISEGLGRAVTVCPGWMHPRIVVYRALAGWNLPKGRRASQAADGAGVERGEVADARKGGGKKKVKTTAAVKKVLRSFLEFVDSSGLKRLTTNLRAMPSDTTIQIGTVPAYSNLKTGMEETPASNGQQPTAEEDIVARSAFDAPAGRRRALAAPTAGGDAQQGVLYVSSEPGAQENLQLWHPGYRQLTLYEGLFSLVDAIRSVVDGECTRQRDILLSYDAFIERHKYKIISILETDHRVILTTWKNHNTQLKSLCVG
ncbi:hypothetical protein DIPPA_07147 [Diplonema papillatum]|nr:hypothetical protein DIPPA_07147 [Diplonema papillatum]